MSDPERGEARLTALAEAIVDYLAPREPWTDALEALRTATWCPRPASLPAPDPWPALAAGVGDALRSSLAAASGCLGWQRNPGYRGADFFDRYAYAELLGPNGHAPGARHAVGLLYLAGGTRYPAHAHPAEEAYHVLTEGSEWSNAGRPARVVPAGDRIEHPSGLAHAMRAGRQPLVALYLWRGEVSVRARLV